MATETIAIAIIAAVAYALAGYLKTVGENFDKIKFGVTALIGAVVGVILYTTGVPITEESVTVQMAAYMGLIVLTEFVLKAMWRKLQFLGKKNG